MTPEKKLRVAKVGLKNLGDKIRVRRDELEPLVQAHLELMKMKWDAEKRLITVKQIPIGATRASVAKEKEQLEKSIADMSEDQAEELMAKLKRRLG